MPAVNPVLDECNVWGNLRLHRFAALSLEIAKHKQLSKALDYVLPEFWKHFRDFV